MTEDEATIRDALMYALRIAPTPQARLVYDAALKALDRVREPVDLERLRKS